jgi:hypothetical protein
LHVYRSSPPGWTAITTITVSAEPLAEFIAGLAEEDNASEGAALVGYRGRTLHDRLSSNIYLADFGADPTGTNDCTSALVAAIAAAKSLGHSAVNCSGGTWRIHTGGISLEDIALYADSPPDFADTYGNSGAVFSLTGTSTSPFLVERGWSLRNLTFYYPNQDGSTVNPIVYPPLFTGGYVAGVDIDNCTVLNAYDVFEFTDDHAVGDFRLTNCRIYGIHSVFEFYQGAPEIINITDSLFSHGIFEPALEPNTYLRNYTATNGTFFLIDVGSSSHTSVDGLDIHDNHIFGYRYGIRIVSGSLNISNIHDNSFDQVSTAISIEGIATMIGTRIHDNVFWSSTVNDATAAHNTIDVSTAHVLSNLFIHDNDFPYTQGNHIYWNAIALTDFQISGNRFKSWGRTTDTPASSYYAIAATSAVMDGIISNNSFKAVVGSVAHSMIGIISANSTDLAIYGNEFDDCYLPVWVVNGTNVKVFGNESSGTTYGAAFKNDSASGIVKSIGNLWDRPTDGATGLSYVIAKASSQLFSGIKTKVLFDTVVVDRDFNFINSTFTAGSTGLYEFEVLLHNGNGCTLADAWSISFEQGGSDSVIFASIQCIESVTYGSTPLRLSGSMYLAAGDTVNTFVTRVYGEGTYTTLNDGTFNTFSAKRVIE